MNVSDYIAKFFKEKGVRHIFGFQGGAILKIVDTMVDNGIEYIQNFHEQASSFCADAYGRIDGNIGLAIATSGPGATNLINGIANAHFDSVPAIFITGQDYTTNINKPENVRQNGFQDLDIINMVKPISKYAVTIKNPQKIKYELQKAYYFATSGRKGAVVIDIPIDVQFAEINEEELEEFIPEKIKYSYEIKKVIDLIKSSRRPVILAGGGIRISGAIKEFHEFIKMSKIPVVATLNGLDSYDDIFSFAGLHGNTFSNLAVLNADLLIVLGSRLGQRQVGKKIENYTKAKIIHVDIDKAELGRAVSEEVSILGDVKEFLTLINKDLGTEELPSFSNWYNHIKNWEMKYSANTQLNNKKVDPVLFVKNINACLDDNAIITADVGQNEMWVAQGVKIKSNQRFLMSSGFGSMGYSLPAAIGAAYANNEAQIISFTGDGGLMMNLQELHTLKIKNKNIKCFVFNNNTLGMMREVQGRYFNRNYIGANVEEFSCPDLEMLAKTFGVNYLEISSNNEIAKIQSVLQNKESYLINVLIQYDSVLLNRYDESEIFEKEKIND